MAADRGALAGALPSPPLPARARARAPAPPTRARWLLVPAALAALAALWVLSRPAPSPSPVALAARDAAPAPTAPGPVDLLGQMDEAHAVWAGTRPPWGAGASAVQGLDPVSDIFSSGLLTEAIGTVGEPQTSND